MTLHFGFNINETYGYRTMISTIKLKLIFPYERNYFLNNKEFTL